MRGRNATDARRPRRARACAVAGSLRALAFRHAGALIRFGGLLPGAGLLSLGLGGVPLGAGLLLFGGGALLRRLGAGDVRPVAHLSRLAAPLGRPAPDREVRDQCHHDDGGGGDENDRERAHMGLLPSLWRGGDPITRIRASEPASAAGWGGGQD